MTLWLLLPAAQAILGGPRRELQDSQVDTMSPPSGTDSAQLPSDIEVTAPGTTELPSDIEVTAPGTTEWPSDIEVTAPGTTALPSDIEVTTPGTTEWPSDIEVTAPGTTEWPSDIEVTAPGTTETPSDVELVVVDEAGEKDTCSAGYCKCYLAVPVCHGSNAPCAHVCGRPVDKPLPPRSTPPGECPPWSYCKCWQTPAVCHGTDEACSCEPEAPVIKERPGAKGTSVGLTWEDSMSRSCPAGEVFADDFSEGLSDERWRVLFKKQGEGNNGFNPYLVSIQEAEVNGVWKNVVRMETTGDQYKGPIQGVEKRGDDFVFTPVKNTRVGSGICTKQEFGSGTFEAWLKVDGFSGNVPTLWTSHVEEHHPYNATNDFSAKWYNPHDPLYRPHAREKHGDYWMSTVRSEIAFPYVGYGGRYDYGLFSVRKSNLESYIKPSRFEYSISDNQFHKFRMEWRTDLVPSSCKDTLVDPSNGITYCRQFGHEDQGYPLMFDEDVSLAHKGVYVSYFLDEQLQEEVTYEGPSWEHAIPHEAGHFCVGNWLPLMGGFADLVIGVMWLSDVRITPANGMGDVCWQEETKNPGLVLPSEFVQVWDPARE